MERQGSGSLRPLALGALVALGWFVVALIVLNVVQRGQYDALRQAGSRLALGKGGWLLTIGFCGLGIGTLLVAWLIRRTAPEARAVPPLLAVAGVLQFVAAVSPTDANGASLTNHGLVHNLAGLVSFLLYVAAMVVAGFSFRMSLEWRSFSRATTVWSICAVVSLLLTFILGGLGFFGLGERIALVALVSWLVAVAWRVQARPSLGVPETYAGLSAVPEPEGRRS